MSNIAVIAEMAEYVGENAPKPADGERWIKIETDGGGTPTAFVVKVSEGSEWVNA